MKMILLLLSIIPIVPGVAFAQSFYAEGSLGIGYVPTLEDDLGGGSVSGSAGVSESVALGLRGNSFRLEANLRAQHNDINKSSATSILPMVNIYRDFFNESPLTPYLGVGMGMSKNYYGRNLNHDKTAKFAWNFIGGIAVQLIDHLELTANYGYLGTIDDSNETAAGGEYDFRTHNFTLGLRYSLGEKDDWIGE